MSAIGSSRRRALGRPLRQHCRPLGGSTDSRPAPGGSQKMGNQAQALFKESPRRTSTSTGLARHARHGLVLTTYRQFIQIIFESHAAGNIDLQVRSSLRGGSTSGRRSRRQHGRPHAVHRERLGADAALRRERQRSAKASGCRARVMAHRDRSGARPRGRHRRRSPGAVAADRSRPSCPSRPPPPDPVVP